MLAPQVCFVLLPASPPCCPSPMSWDQPHSLGASRLGRPPHGTAHNLVASGCLWFVSRGHRDSKTPPSTLPQLSWNVISDIAFQEVTKSFFLPLLGICKSSFELQCPCVGAMASECFILQGHAASQTKHGILPAEISLSHEIGKAWPI